MRVEPAFIFVAVQHKSRGRTGFSGLSVMQLQSLAKTDRPVPRKARAIFPAPGHDHDRCASDALAQAEVICAERAQRLTPIRRRVLEALLASHHPLGAYE